MKKEALIETVCEGLREDSEGKSNCHEVRWPGFNLLWPHMVEGENQLPKYVSLAPHIGLDACKPTYTKEIQKVYKVHFKIWWKLYLKCDGSVCSCCVQTLHQLPQGASASTGSGGGDDSWHGGWGKPVTVVNGPSEDVSLELEESVFRTCHSQPRGISCSQLPSLLWIDSSCHF